MFSTDKQTRSPKSVLENDKLDVYKKAFILQKNAFIQSTWSNCRSIGILLDQIGLPAHRVFSKEAHQTFEILNNESLDYCLYKACLTHVVLSQLSNELLRVQSQLFAAMDELVVTTLETDRKHQTSVSLVKKLLNQKTFWAETASARFDQVICSVLEQKLCR
ncbi:hypothetical protein HR060_13655 [Catenovulum sp. SM1970]|uniref:hypothetical protein n=1 Tax=Marinifaba aquimaris TaxID=2741323 RepID=UPI0015733461|nr:hypothetical protein [Marinifaba aquimaris]NTS77900.1 hypothetical protein [Marinifaba aquimaris]